MNRLRTVALALLVVLAGCSGADTTTAPSADQNGVTETIAPQTTTDTTPSADERPPGVGADDIDADALVSAHQDRLRGSSYSLSVTQQSAGTELGLSARTSSGTTPALFSVRTARANQTTYVTDSEALQQTAGPNGTVFNTPDTTGDDIPTGASYVRNALDDANFRSNGTLEQGGQTFYRISADRPDLTEDFDGVDVSAFDAEAFVDGDGVVRSLGYRVVFSTDNGTQTRRVGLSVSSIGSTTVPEPGWLNRARDAGQQATSRTVTAPGQGTGLTVSGTQTNVSTVALSNASSRFYGNDVVDAARSSAVVTVESPDPVAVESIRMDYDTARVPEDGESGLVVFAYLPAYESFVPMETGYDPRNETVRATGLQNVTATVDGESVRAAFDGLDSGTTFVVMHAPTYVDELES